MTAFLPPCARCKCSAEEHATVLAPAVDEGELHMSEMFELGACKSCDCPNCQVHVPNPRMVSKVEGIQ